ncbi:MULTISPECIES: hypothetical protein [Nocardia]|uniref:hypothetical protein n=1 Tax=Nocardia TaxID=1817 RepID=UPI001894FA4B|nr:MULTISPECIES: hypothetical protein [Nocardia]MBF6348011.1 hypothetical protein [Nocardia flavorosea]
MSCRARIGARPPSFGPAWWAGAYQWVVATAYVTTAKAGPLLFRAMGSPAGRIARLLAAPLVRFNYLSIVGLLDPRPRTSACRSR